MPNHITDIKVTIWTATGKNSGTSDNVFLGLGGREFGLKTEATNFQSGQKDVFILGNESNILKSAINDPGKPQLTTDDLLAFPVYIRKAGTLQGEDDNAWKVERVDVHGTYFALSYFQRLKGPDDIWLSNESGLVLFLNKISEIE